MNNDDIRQRLEALHDTLQTKIRLTHYHSNHAADKALQRFIDQLSASGPQLHIRREDPPMPEWPLPGIGIAENIIYHAVPEGVELAPFLDALTVLANGTDALSLAASARERVTAVNVPAHLQLYIAPQCTFCPRMVRQMLALALTNTQLHLRIIDGFLFRAQAETAKIKAVPTLILEDQYRWTGSVDSEELIHMILERDPQNLSATSLQNMLEQGEAKALAQMMQDAGTVFKGFWDLLCHAKWSVRLGAMVTFEYLADSDPQLAARAMPLVWQRYEQVEDTVKGDLLQVIAEAGGPSDIQRLEAAKTSTTNIEIQEAAQEALIQIAERLP
jgi:hypothetical protein